MEKKLEISNTERRNLALCTDFRKIKSEQPLASRNAIIKVLSEKYFIGYHMCTRILKEQGL